MPLSLLPRGLSEGYWRRLMELCVLWKSLAERESHTSTIEIAGLRTRAEYHNIGFRGPF